MLKKLIALVVLPALLMSLLISPQGEAHDGTHTYSSCYSLISFYSGWPRDNLGRVYINYTYTQRGEIFYGYRIQLAGDEWSDHFSFFNFNNVSSGENAKWISDDYGDTGWVGKAYFRNDPKELYLNEWYHWNYSNYDYIAYQRTAIHEYGHTHGLDHTSCVSEIMSNNANRDIKQTDIGDGDWSGIQNKY